jgi:hypothetical protein
MALHWHGQPVGLLPVSPPPPAATSSLEQDGAKTRDKRLPQVPRAHSANLHTSLALKFTADLLLMSGARSTDGRNEKCIQSIGRKT